MNALQSRLTADQIAQFLARAMRLLSALADEGIELHGEEDPVCLMCDIGEAANVPDGEDWSILFEDAQPNPENIREATP
jgi:hypothetical protein